MACSFLLCCFRLCKVFDGDSLAGIRFVMRMPRRSRDLHIANKAVVDHDPRAVILLFSSIRSTSYLWDSCMNHSSLTFPVALSS